MPSFNFFYNIYIKFGLSGLDETRELVEELARLLRLEPSDESEGVQVIVFSSDHPPDEVDAIRHREKDGGQWRSHNVQNRMRILESPDRKVFLCGIEHYPSLYPTQLVRWHLASMVVDSVLTLLSNRLVLIHGALIASGDSAYVLTGPSGVGKTTAAGRVPPPWTAPADDLVAAVSTPDGYVVFPLPTWSQLESGAEAFRPGDTNKPYPLSGIYSLEQSVTDGAEAIPQTDAIARLLLNSYEVSRQTLEYFTDEGRLRCKRELLMHVTRILDRTPCGVLKVSREGRFWELLPAK